QITSHRAQVAGRSEVQVLLITATLVLLLDLQIEPIATGVNQYWVWLDHGPYYGVPTANFVAWWVVGAAMALIVGRGLRPEASVTQRESVQENETFKRSNVQTFHDASQSWHWPLRLSRLTSFIPAYLYLLSTLMFAAINLARGYTLAGAIGGAVL